MRDYDGVWRSKSVMRFCPVALREHCANRNLRGAVQSD